MPSESITILLLGFSLGLKHALDADHLIAVATLVSERKGVLTSSLVGLAWGLGHTAALLAVGAVVVALEIQIPERVSLMLEFAVAVMLIVLGIRALGRLLRGATLHIHVHSHHGRVHIHPHVHSWKQAHDHPPSASHHESRSERVFYRILVRVSDARTSLIVGMVHGLAGSGALMLIVLATIPSPLVSLAYILAFGMGSIGGMVVMSAVVGIPFGLSAHGPRFMQNILYGTAAAFSVGFGVFLAYHIGWVGGLFTQ